MTNFDKANNLASEWVESMGGLEAIRHDHGSDLSGLVQALDDAGLLAPDLPNKDFHWAVVDPDGGFTDFENLEDALDFMEGKLEEQWLVRVPHPHCPPPRVTCGSMLSIMNYEYAVAFKSTNGLGYLDRSGQPQPWLHLAAWYLTKENAQVDLMNSEYRKEALCIVRRRVSQPEVINE